MFIKCLLYFFDHHNRSIFHYTRSALNATRIEHFLLSLRNLTRFSNAAPSKVSCFTFIYIYQTYVCISLTKNNFYPMKPLTARMASRCKAANNKIYVYVYIYSIYVYNDILSQIPYITMVRPHFTRATIRNTVIN